MLFTNFLTLFLESAPWLLLGLLLAGLLKIFIPMQWMHKQLGGHGIKTTIKAALLGAPLPLCSCGVIPAAIGLRRAGASKAATTSFLVATPETGVDSITVSYVLLGPFMAIVRPIAAIVSAIVAGILVGRDEILQNKDAQLSANSPKTAAQATHQSCCAGAKENSCTSAPDKNKNESDCCAATDDIASEFKDRGTITRIAKGLHFAGTDLVDDITVSLLIGLFFAALVQTYLPDDFMLEWGNGILAMLVIVIISIPMYICATASTPIAAGLLLAGVSPGAVLVFMLAGPATNIATISVVATELGKRALWAYLGGVLSVALLSGILVNYLVATFAFNVMPMIGEQHALLPATVVYGSGILLAVLMIKALLSRLWVKSAHNNCCS